MAVNVEYQELRDRPIHEKDLILRDTSSSNASRPWIVAGISVDGSVIHRRFHEEKAGMAFLEEMPFSVRQPPVFFDREHPAWPMKLA
tara:strand:+ start:237 stop:497 length:261 start_codon:yes stop_codon:yes gene_type:complete